MDKPLSYWIPEWMASSIRECVCVECQTKIKRKDVIAVGIRTSGTGKDVFFTEYKCGSCDFRTIVTFEDRSATLRELCYTLLEEVQNKKNTEQAVRTSERPQGRMSLQETKKFLKFVKDCKTHDEFMKFIGSPLPERKVKPKVKPKSKSKSKKCKNKQNNDEIQDK